MQENTKPQTEVTEETRETLHVLELRRTPRPEKLALERSYFDGAHEVRFTERTFLPKHPAGLDEVRAFVDSLEVRRRELPPLPPPPVVARPTVPGKVPDHFREPLEAVIEGALVSVETVHRAGSGTVVDVAWEDRTGAEQRALFVVEDGVARRHEEVAARVDEMQAPHVDAPAPPPPEPSVAAPAPPEEKPAKKRRFGFGRK